MTGLLAPAPIKWLLSTEPDVFRAVTAFIAGMGEPTVTVAGPPDEDDLLRSKLLDTVTPLPAVVLRMRMERHHISGIPHLEVLASDAEVDEIERWRLRSLRQKNERLLQHLQGTHILPEQ